jgi:hypothetical protein
VSLDDEEEGDEDVASLEADGDSFGAAADSPDFVPSLLGDFLA